MEESIDLNIDLNREYRKTGDDTWEELEIERTVSKAEEQAKLLSLEDQLKQLGDFKPTDEELIEIGKQGHPYYCKRPQLENQIAYQEELIKNLK